MSNITWISLDDLWKQAKDPKAKGPTVIHADPIKIMDELLKTKQGQDMVREAAKEIRKAEADENQPTL